MKKRSFASVDEQLSLIRRGTAAITVEAELASKLDRARKTGVPLTVKLGLDPTAPDLHLGHTVVLQKLRDFQVLGHQVTVILGDFTGMIGDPTGRSETRKPLTLKEIRGNAETYRKQLGKVLDMTQVRIRRNSSWLSKLTFEDIIRLSSHVTVAQMLQREDFSSRYADGRPISAHEFLYPLAQGYDSVALKADVELGGTDQTFNLLVGRDLQRAYGQEAQVAVTTPILEGLDGVQKMSKSLGNYVGINEPAKDIFGKVMSVPDALMWRYFELLTRLAPSEIETMRQWHPMDAKKRLAQIITGQYAGERAAVDAAANFRRTVQEREIPDIVETAELPCEGPRMLWSVVREAGFVPSNSEARRLVLQGAVEVDGKKIADPNWPLNCGASYLFKVGKRRFKRVKLQS